MLASLWQLAQARVFFPAGSLQSFSPRSTHSMPGLAKASFCRARRSGPRNAEPDLSSPGGIARSCASATPAASAAAARAIAARFGDRVELHVGIGRDARGQIGAEHFHSGVAARQDVDDVALDEMPDVVVAVTGLHRVLDQDADFDDVTAPGVAGNLDSCGHGMRLLRLSSRRDRRKA